MFLEIFAAIWAMISIVTVTAALYSTHQVEDKAHLYTSWVGAVGYHAFVVFATTLAAPFLLGISLGRTLGAEKKK